MAILGHAITRTNDPVMGCSCTFDNGKIHTKYILLFHHHVLRNRLRGNCLNGAERPNAGDLKFRRARMSVTRMIEPL